MGKPILLDIYELFVNIVDRGSWIVEHGPNPTDYPRASTNVGA